MTPAGFALVFAAALCHAAWNFFYKRIGGGLELIWLFSVVSAVLYAPLALWVFLGATYSLDAMAWLFIAGSTTLHLVYFALLQRGYRDGDLSVVYPTARATGPMLTAFAAVVFFSQPISMQAALGIALIVGGVFMLSGTGRSAGAGDARRAGLSIAYGLAIGVLIAAYTLWDRHAVAVLLIPPLLLDYFPSLARSALLAPIAWNKRDAVAQQWRHHRVGVLAIAILAPLGYILVLYALTFTPVIYVAPTRELSVLFTVLLGTLVLKEAAAGPRLAWAMVMVAGVALLATG
jgi:drug/metabolite transporter (DMT)-like permease